MKGLLRGRRAYIDTNVFVYVATGHPEFYSACMEVLEMVAKGEARGLGSHLVLFELFGALSKLSPVAAYEAADAHLSLPIRLVAPTRRTLKVARDVAELANVTYDALHAALAAEGGAEIIVTEDLEHWRRIASAWSKVARKHELGDLQVLSPTQGPL